MNQKIDSNQNTTRCTIVVVVVVYSFTPF